MAYRGEVLVGSMWCNGHIFATAQEANDYVMDLAERWPSILGTRVTEVPHLPTHRFVEGRRVVHLPLNRTGQ